MAGGVGSNPALGAIFPIFIALGLYNECQFLAPVQAMLCVAVEPTMCMYKYVIKYKQALNTFWA